MSIPDGWKAVKLGSILTLHYGKALKAENRKIGNVPVYSSGGLTGYHDTALVNSKGIIVGRKGTIGKVFYSSKPFCCIDTAYYILPNNNIYNFNYLFYLLTTLGLDSLNEDSAVPGLNRDTAYQQEVLFPSLSEQKAIAGVLSVLDDKIDLLHRQNKTLETMAETLFRQWFIEEAQDDWEEKALGDLMVIKRGGSPRPIQDFLFNEGYHWLKISDVSNVNSPYILNIKEYIKQEGLKKTVYLNAGQLVLSNSATPGIPKIIMVDTCIHDGWLYFLESSVSNEFLYLLFNYIRPELLLSGNGSIFTNLKTDIIKQFKIKLPTKNKLSEFQIIVLPLFNKIKSNTYQIQTLEKLRDTLLPRLMRGEIRVHYENTTS